MVTPHAFVSNHDSDSTLALQGPIADQTREIPFEELNSLQNPFLVPGRSAYMKGIPYRESHYPSILEAFKRVIAMTAHQRTPQMSPVLLFEYFPLSKINSVLMVRPRL